MATRLKYDEEEIINQLHQQATCRTAFGKVIEHYSEQLYWHIRRMVIDHDDTNDVLQNTFIKAWTNIDNFRGDAKLSTWLYKIAINESITFINKKKVQNNISLDDDDSFLVNSLEADRYFDGDEAQIRLQKAIATLEQLQEEQGSDADEYTMNGFSISASALQRGLFYYDMALRMYEGSDTTTEWTDLLGLLAPTEAVQQILEDILSGDISTIEMLEDHMHDIYDSYAQWKGYNDNDAEREQAIAEWKEAIRHDAEREFEMGDVSEEQLADFLEGLKN